MNVLVMALVMAFVMMLAHGGGHHEMTPPPPAPAIHDDTHEASTEGCGHPQHRLQPAARTSPDRVEGTEAERHLPDEEK